MAKLPTTKSSGGKMTIYVDPMPAQMLLTHDSGWASVGTPTLEGRQGYMFKIPDGTAPGAGALLEIHAEGMVPISLRGILTVEGKTAYLRVDDFHLQPAAPPPSPGPSPFPPSNNPQEIIEWVYAQGNHDLSTHEGCGVFTESCCISLHDYNNQMWGHIRKNPGQNQYNGHAVDAIQCLAGEFNGIWDIIHDSVSPNATPAFNHKGPADPALWYYPA